MATKTGASVSSKSSSKPRNVNKSVVKSGNIKKKSDVKNKSTSAVKKNVTPQKSVRQSKSSIKKRATKAAAPVHKRFVSAFAIFSLLVFGVIGLVGVVTASLSYAASQSGPTGQIVGSGAKCLDNKEGKVVNGNKIQLFTCNGSDPQKWSQPGDGTLRVQGYCLDVKGSSRIEGTLVQLYECNGTDAQKWAIKGEKSLVNPASGLCLDAQNSGTTNGTQIWLWGCNGTGAQEWSLPTTTQTALTTSAATNLAGPIKGSSGKCLDIRTGTLVNGNKIQLYTCNGTSAQQWSILTDNTIRVQNFCLDVKGGATTQETLVQLYQCNNTDAQKWVVKSDQSIINPKSGLCLDAQYAGTANGTQIWLWGCNGTGAQKWSLPTTTTATPTAPAPVSSPAPAPIATGTSTLSSVRLDTEPNTVAAQQANKFRSEGNITSANLMDKIGNTPKGSWLGGWSGDIRSAVANKVNGAASRGGVATLIAYNIPNRDCSGYSAGGASSATDYRTWIDGLAAGIGGRQTIVILEPDALGLTDCLSAADRQTRFDLMKYAGQKITSAGGIVYLDAGHAGWRTPSDMANRLNAAGIGQVRGFSLNVSNFGATSNQITYGNAILSNLGGSKKFVIDTSRNARATAGSEWCNPAGQGLGNRPTTNTGHSGVDAYLWLKYPGESDGYCNGGPAAGQWWLSYAMELARNASW